MGEGEYNLNSLKEIQVSDSYLELDPNIIKCQKIEPFFNCTTRQYLNTFMRDCGCLPVNMRVSSTEVKTICKFW